MHLVLLLAIFTVASSILPVAYAVPGELCFEKDPLVDCNFIDAPLEALVKPFEAIFGEWFMVIIWGLILGILWLRTQNIMLVGIVGIIVSTTITTFYEPARAIGWFLMAIAIGVTLYQLFVHRVHQSTV